MNKFLVFIFFSALIFAVPASKDDIKILINYMDKRFDDVNKRFDDVNKRFEEARIQTDKRFDDVNKRFDDVNKRFEEARIQTDKRFDDVNKRFDDVNQKFNFMENIMIVMLGFMATVVSIGIWDRYTIMKETKKEIALEVKKKVKESKEKITLETISKLKEKVDKSILEKIALILEKVVEGNSEAKEIFSKHRLIFS